MYAQLNSQIIYYEKVGEGEKNLIMLHGNGEDHTIFEELAKALSDAYTIYLPDTRGHGQSATPKKYHYEDFAKDLLNLADFLHISDLKPDVLGFSDGAVTAILAAIGKPDLFGRLYLCGANLSPKDLKFGAAQKIKKEWKKTKDPLSELMLREPDIDPVSLGVIRSEVCMFWGEDDIFKDSAIKSIIQSFSNVRLSMFPQGYDHSSYVVHSDYLAKYILD